MVKSVRTKHLASVVVALAAVVACSSSLAPGGVGTIRYAGRVKGVAPLPILPPVSDPSGNIYVLNGAPTLPEIHAFVGAVGGGWKEVACPPPAGCANCAFTKGDATGAHGWSGYAQSRAWYWSGSALVAVSGTDGNCHAVLDRDRATNADLLFQAVMPVVRNLAERTTVPALVQTPNDPAPFSALVDLDAELLTNVQAFSPANAQDVQVVGVGGVRESERGVVLVQYRQGTRAFLELRHYDGEANPTASVPIAGGPFSRFAVQGYLQLDDGDLVAGLVQSGGADGSMMLLTADASGGDVTTVDGIAPVGVHRWGGALWLVGLANRAPAVAPIHRGGIGAIVPWISSEGVAGSFQGTTEVRDDRSLPSRAATWTDVRTAVGDWPFLSAHSLTEHAPQTTLWTFEGPTSTDSVLKLTAFGVAPCGVTYP